MAVPALVGAGLVGVACTTSNGPPPGLATPSLPAATSPGPGPSVPAGAAGEQQDLTQAQQDIADLEKALSDADSGLNANPATEGDVNP